MSIDRAECNNSLSPNSGCFSCDVEIEQLMDALGAELSDGRKQSAALRVGSSICAEACREDCSTFDCLRENVEDAVEVEKANYLMTLEQELLGLRKDKYVLDIGPDDGNIDYHISMFDKDAADSATLFNVMAVMYDNLFGERVDELLPYKPAKGSQIFVATDRSGEVVGALELVTNNDEKRAEILAIGVNEEDRGTGVGTGLVQLAEKFASGSNMKSLEVVPTSESKAFYEKTGMFAQVNDGDGELVKVLI